MRKPGMIEIHTAVLLFGLVGLFGKFLTLPAIVIVFGRTFFALLTLGTLLGCSKTSLKTRSRRDIVFLILLGMLLAVHWTTFFYSVQISTVAIGLLTFSTFPLFVTFMEPLMFRERLRLFDIITAICILFGLGLVVPSFDFSNHVTQGAFWGTMAGLTFAILSLLNRKYVKSYSPLVIGWYQNSIACLTLFPFLFRGTWTINRKDIFLLALLGIFCTALAHVLFISSLKHVRTQLASIIAGLEPVYGIVFAYFLLDEIPSLRTLLGGVVILGTVAIASRGKR